MDTICIFEKPDLYFFPEYPDTFYAPFAGSNRSIPYLIYKILYVLGIPWYSFYWGSWKKQIKKARQVIIFDYGYQKGMETYIHRINPDCKVYLFFWNVITPRQSNHRLFTDKEAIYSTDKGCCQQYHFRYKSICYTKKYYQPYDSNYQRNLLFLGADKGRGEELLSLKRILEDCGYLCDIRVFYSGKDFSYRKRIGEILIKQRMDYRQYCGLVRQSGVLLDINQKGQVALTLRVMEAIYFSKKLITNNQDIVNYDFYHPDNIYVLPEEIKEADREALKEFLERPFNPYSGEILNEYDFEHWKEESQW